MLEGNDHFHGNGKDIISYCTEMTMENHSYFFSKKSTWTDKIKQVIIQYMDCGILESMTLKHDTEEELKNFQSINGVYNTVFRMSNCWYCHAGKKWKLQRQNYSGYMEHKKHEQWKLNIMEERTDWLQIYILGVSELKWTFTEDYTINEKTKNKEESFFCSWGGYRKDCAWAQFDHWPNNINCTL